MRHPSITRHGLSVLFLAATIAVAHGCASGEDVAGSGTGGGSGAGGGAGVGGGSGGAGGGSVDPDGGPASSCGALAGPVDDPDDDGFVTGDDNCECMPNPDQHESDGDVIGDACDNCPGVANYHQVDGDLDGIGDECEAPISATEDYDGDGVADTLDNCWRDPNTNQLDFDSDLRGDACDNCPSIANHGQDDGDKDGTGDACAGTGFEDGDDDGVPNELDNCPSESNPANALGVQADTDADGVGDACDNCVDVPNNSQDSAACAGGGALADYDGDGIPDLTDNCPAVANAPQTDADADGRGDVVGCDNCLGTYNPLQQDADVDGQGDHCEPALSLPADEPACEGASLETTLVKPNVYFLIDISGSMEQTAGDGLGSRWAELTDALDTIAADVVDRFNIGVGVFPARPDTSLPCLEYFLGFCVKRADVCHELVLPDEVLDLTASHTAAEFMAAYAIGTGGMTPTSTALEGVRKRALYNLPTSDGVSRPEVVVLITDGDPNSPDDECDLNTSGLTETITEAGLLYGQDVPVYLLGFDGVNETNMQRIACAGRGYPYPDATQRWYEVSSAATIVSALEAISGSIVSCTLALEPDASPSTVPDHGRIAVTTSVNGVSTVVPRITTSNPTNGWAFVAGSPNQIQLRGTACATLESAAAAGSTVDVDVKVACEGTCPGDTEICGDLVDNDCDGQTNEECSESCWCTMVPVPSACTDVLASGCPSACTPMLEVCNAVDDDCDGMADEGCCVADDGEICGDGLDNDCDGIVDDGCMCYPEICNQTDDDCDGAVDEGCPVIIG